MVSKSARVIGLEWTSTDLFTTGFVTYEGDLPMPIKETMYSKEDLRKAFEAGMEHAVMSKQKQRDEVLPEQVFDDFMQGLHASRKQLDFRKTFEG
jgi:hypothetical protein